MTTNGSEEMTGMGAALNAKTVGFCRLLRQQGFSPGLRESQDALAVAGLFLVTDFSAFHDGMRALLCCAEDERAKFDRLFEDYWAPEDGSRAIVPVTGRPKRKTIASRGGLPVTTGFAERPDARGETRLTTGASAMETHQGPDLSALPPEHQQVLERAAERLWRRLSLNRARRLRGERWRKRLNFRRTIRRNLSNGGEPFSLVFDGHKAKKPRLVALLDVSGSMETHSFLFLRLLHALQWRFRRCATFVFSTGLVEVTPAMDNRDVTTALGAVSRLKMGWNGGTQIGRSLRQLVEEHGARVLRRDTVLIVLSDGLDVGPPEELAEALGRARARVDRVIWLNPLLGTRDYQPTARGMAAALPLVDVFAPAHDLNSLLDIESYLVK